MGGIWAGRAERPMKQPTGGHVGSNGGRRSWSGMTAGVPGPERSWLEPAHEALWPAREAP
ncbi:MAG: hypothetical protein ACK559_18255 [bacterium]